MSAEPAAPAPRKGPHWLVLLFALVGLMGVVALIVIAGAILGTGRSQQPARVAGETADETYAVGSVQDLAGTNLVQINIAASTGSSGSSFSSSSGREDLRNILLLDKASGATRRLLPDNERRIERSYFLPAEADFVPDSIEMADASAEAPPPPAYYALLVEQAEERGRVDVLVGTLAGGEQAYVMRGLEGVDEIWMHSPTRIGLIVRERLNLYYRIVDIPSLRVVQSRRIAI